MLLCFVYIHSKHVLAFFRKNGKKGGPKCIGRLSLKLSASCQHLIWSVSLSFSFLHLAIRGGKLQIPRWGSYLEIDCEKLCSSAGRVSRSLLLSWVMDNTAAETLTFTVRHLISWCTSNHSAACVHSFCFLSEGFIGGYFSSEIFPAARFEIWPPIFIQKNPKASEASLKKEREDLQTRYDLLQKQSDVRTLAVPSVF